MWHDFLLLHTAHSRKFKWTVPSERYNIFLGISRKNRQRMLDSCTAYIAWAWYSHGNWNAELIKAQAFKEQCAIPLALQCVQIFHLMAHHGNSLIRFYKCQRKCYYLSLIYDSCFATGESLFLGLSCKVFTWSCLFMGFKSLKCFQT